MSQRLQMLCFLHNLIVLITLHSSPVLTCKAFKITLIGGCTPLNNTINTRILQRNSLMCKREFSKLMNWYVRCVFKSAKCIVLVVCFY